eukprot:4216405-Alexandrium_andersonii.AAC.1
MGEGSPFQGQGRHGTILGILRKTLPGRLGFVEDFAGDAAVTTAQVLSCSFRGNSRGAIQTLAETPGPCLSSSLGLPK